MNIEREKYKECQRCLLRWDLFPAHPDIHEAPFSSGLAVSIFVIMYFKTLLAALTTLVLVGQVVRRHHDSS